MTMRYCSENKPRGTLGENPHQNQANPFSPVFLPEFGVKVSWTTCLNPACSNFGVHYEGPALGERKSVSDKRYRIQANDGRITCRSCGLTAAVKSNRAIRVVARYFLQLSLPFADCPNADCENHGINLFEHWYPDKKRRPYRRQGDHRASCRSCGERFNTGEALQLRRKKVIREQLEDVILGIVHSKHQVSSGIDRTRLPAPTYYSRQTRAAVRLRDWHSWRNAKLLHRKFQDRQEPLEVFTDTFKVSLQKPGVARRYQYLNIIISSVKLEGSYFILAAHPDFLPEERCPDAMTMLHEMDKPPYIADWDCLQFSLGRKASGSVRALIRSLPDVGRKGYFMKPQYVEAAHFLVVRKMLSRFPKIHLYMDGSRSQFQAALMAFANDVRHRRVEIALFQHQNEERKATGHYKPPVDPPDSAWNDMQTRFAEKVDDGATVWDCTFADRERLAQEFRKGFGGAYSKNGKWAWLEYPPYSSQYKNPRTLWLTWAPDKRFEEIGRQLLWEANLDPVDSAINWLRERVNSVQRGKGRHRPGRSYKTAAQMPLNVMQELWLGILWRNYGVRFKAVKKIPPAKPMGLMRPKESDPDLVNLAWDFRLGLKHAQRMTKWRIR